MERVKLKKANESPKQPVQVFCRLRPLLSEADMKCVKVKDFNTVILSPPEIAVNYKLNCKEMQYIFKYVFQENSGQRAVYEKVARPLVENLVRGKNSLLFTYGVTGSGKTFTMTGDTKEQGIMPRCLDALFKTISDYQTKKFVFKPDRLNGFEILSDADALLERQAEMNSRFAKPKRKDSDPEIASKASTEAKPIDGLDEDNMYAVFITYVEIYNNSVFDLLEETGIQRTLQSKIVREDANHNMFVHGVTEVEIKSMEEALEIFQTGQKRKRMGHTILNAESSRSHSVFTIRLVQAPVDSQGEDIMRDKSVITVSQLSLVDLAGSERTNRTKNTGQRLREAGNINNSLMTLRTCMEYLRENQLNNANRKIPYRDSKLTHLFKNFFEGEGLISMIVCINPRAEDFDENSQVMKFAEMSQEVQITRNTPMKTDFGLTPGRRKANKIFKTAVENLNSIGLAEARKLDTDIGLVYNLGPNFPDFKIDSPEMENVITDLMKHLERRIQKRKLLIGDFENRCNRFRMTLFEMEKENISLRTELAAAKAAYQTERHKTRSMENKIIVYESSLDDLNIKMRQKDDKIKELQRMLNDKEFELDRKEMEKQKQRKKFTSKLAVEKDKMKSELEIKMSKQRSELEERIKLDEKKFEQINTIMKASRDAELPNVRRSRSTEDLTVVKNVVPSEIRSRQAIYSTTKGVPVANLRHRRSKSTGEKWLEHRSPHPVPLGTILQPYLKNKKFVTKLTDAKDITNPKLSKYCLISQEADTDGEIETKLYKGNVIPTAAGGAQVVFNDVECLKQKSPEKITPPRKRNSECTLMADEVHARCRMSMEGGHSTKKPKV
ncbi:kinesin-like protein KIF23 [Condylostylus longicornis]|uniref:kinesin-like protein KIF23 n=1 Tax=Condylostylus longicornis TaxID=2530218 RepID=UPI00244E3E71|nr:kinesin-like protein KIF23 [Condylostylus longicornis]